MKKIFSYIEYTAIFSLVFFLTTTNAFAAPTVANISQNPTTSTVDTVLTANCDDSVKANGKFNWTTTDGRSSYSIVVQYDTTATPKKQPAVSVKFDPGIYDITAECNGVKGTASTRLTVNPPPNAAGKTRSISFNPNPVRAGYPSTVTVNGCPTATSVNATILGPRSYVLNLGENKPANGEGSFTFPGFTIMNAGDYTVNTVCSNGTLAYPFTVAATNSNAPITLATVPQPLIGSDVNSKLIVTGCPQGSRVHIKWDLGDISSIDNDIIYPGTDPDPTANKDVGAVTHTSLFAAEYVKPFDVGDYSAIVTCGGKRTLLPNAFKVVSLQVNPTFDYAPHPMLANDPASKLIIKGCPEDSPVHLEWRLQYTGFASINNNASTNSSADRTTKNGVAEYSQPQGWNTGTYDVNFTCGKKKFDKDHNTTPPMDLTFEVSADRPTPTPLVCLKGLDANGVETEDRTKIVKCPPPAPPCAEGGLDSAGQCTNVVTGLGDFQTDPVGFIKRLFGVLLSLAGGIAVLIIIYAGYKYLMSAGDPEKTKAAREMLIAAITGLLFMIFSLVILQVIGVNILHIPGFSTGKVQPNIPNFAKGSCPDGSGNYTCGYSTSDTSCPVCSRVQSCATDTYTIASCSGSSYCQIDADCVGTPNNPKKPACPNGQTGAIVCNRNHACITVSCH